MSEEIVSFLVSLNEMSIMRLRGKTAIITGASSGIGEAAALLFAKEGANVVIGARRDDRLIEIAELIRRAGGKASHIAGDVQQEEYAQGLVDLAITTYGGLDIGFNNAGVLGAMGDTSDITAEAWHETLQINLTGAFYGAKHQLKAMSTYRSGSVIFTSSFVGHTIGLPGMAAYGASKAGLIGLTQCLATEFGPQGIRVNALLPGGTITQMAGDFSNDPEAMEGIKALHALKRMAEPNEIAKAALFLASEEASFVTGAAFLVDGGNSITKGG